MNRWALCGYAVGVEVEKGQRELVMIGLQHLLPKLYNLSSIPRTHVKLKGDQSLQNHPLTSIHIPHIHTHHVMTKRDTCMDE